MSNLGPVRTCVYMPAQSTSGGAFYSSTIVDTQGYNRAVFVFSRGGQAQEYDTFMIADSDDNATFTTLPNTTLNDSTTVDVDGASTNTEGSLAQDGTVVFDIPLNGRKRYLRFTAISGGSTTQDGGLCFLFEPSNLGTDVEADYIITQNDTSKGARYARI